MQTLEIILILMASLIALYPVAEKIKISYPILLVLAGLIICLIPGLPPVHIDPDLVFLIFLPPLLYRAAYKTSWHDLKHQSLPIARLAIALILFSTVVVALVAHMLIPTLSWAEAFLLGAIVSPPDVFAATSAVKNLNLSRRVLALLEGESLVNDASALIVYRTALVVVTGGSFVLWSAITDFFILAIGGMVVGIVIGALFSAIHKYVFQNPTIETSLSIIVPFASYLIAENLHVSGVFAVVSAGIFISWKSSELFSHETRLQMSSFWGVAVFILNGFVFIVIGLQLPYILERISDYSLAELSLYGVIISLAAIISRIVWIYSSEICKFLYLHISKQPVTHMKPRLKEAFIVSWSGMRGIVSLAAALALPFTITDDLPFYNRDIILFITFVVILFTLVVQGISLPFIVRALKVYEEPETLINEEKRLRLLLVNASIEHMDNTLVTAFSKDTLEEIRNDLTMQCQYLQHGSIIDQPAMFDQAGLSNHAKIYIRHKITAELELINHQRNLLSTLQKQGGYNENLIDKAQHELDIRNSSLNWRLECLI